RRHDGRRLPLRRLPGRERRREPARRAERRLPVRLPGLRRAGRDRPGAGALPAGQARSYEWLAARWPSRSGELADRLNRLPKYVVSSTLEDPDWNNSTVLKG